MSKPAQVVVAGASGFIGEAVGPLLAPLFSAIGLSRKTRAGVHGYQSFRGCDLFSLAQTEVALEGARYAVYLVHSMTPSAHLTQARFEDLDLLCADNFARAAAKSGVEQIVYLGGILPRTGQLSTHLESRREVEQVLGAYGVPVTTLRAALVIGPGGSSFEILDRLVRRLPVMFTPRWTATLSQPVARADVAHLLAFSVGRTEVYGRTFDVGGPEVLTYRELLVRTAQAAEKRRRIFPVPFLSPRLSRLWVTLVTGAPKALVAPLIESLEHEMIATGGDELFLLASREKTPLDAMLKEAVTTPQLEKPKAFQGPPKGGRRLARSVQRMRVPKGRDAAWAVEDHLRFLPKLFRGGIRVVLEEDGHLCHFRSLGVELLTLRYDQTQRGSDRQILWVVGGLLSGPDQKGRLEFRLLPDGETLITAVHDFHPRLPWPLYRATQALAHAFVMRAFAWSLRYR